MRARAVLGRSQGDISVWIIQYNDACNTEKLLNVNLVWFVYVCMKFKKKREKETENDAYFVSKFVSGKITGNGVYSIALKIKKGKRLFN